MDDKTYVQRAKERIAKLTESQMRIALLGIARGLSFEEALDVAETYD